MKDFEPGDLISLYYGRGYREEYKGTEVWIILDTQRLGDARSIRPDDGYHVRTTLTYTTAKQTLDQPGCERMWNSWDIISMKIKMGDDSFSMTHIKKPKD